MALGKALLQIVISTYMIHSYNGPAADITLSIVIPSLSPSNCSRFIENCKDLDTEYVFVVRDSKEYEDLEKSNARIRVIQTNSRNFSFLRNIGGYFSSGKYIMYAGDDEKFSDELKKSMEVLGKEDFDAYSVIVEVLFGQKIVKMWTRENVRVINRNFYHFIGRVHERYSMIPKKKRKLDGRIVNKSYDSWSHYRRKNLRITKLEEKTLKNIINRAYFPIMDYIFRGGVRGGFQDLKVLFGSIMYAYFICVRGSVPFKQLVSRQKCSLSNMGPYLEKVTSEHEREYATNVLRNLTAGEIPEGSTLDEELQQLLSALEE
jgi:hypothetical protein